LDVGVSEGEPNIQYYKRSLALNWPECRITRSKLSVCDYNLKSVPFIVLSAAWRVNRERVNNTLLKSVTCSTGYRDASDRNFPHIEVSSF